VKILLFFFFLLLIFSCNQPAKVQPMQVTDANEGFQPDSAKQRLLNIIEGGWVNEEYIKAFEQLHSPMAVAAKGLFLQQIAFDISNLSGDTLLNVIGRLKYNEAERFDVIFYSRSNGKTGMKLAQNRNVVLNEFELNYAIEGKDTILLVYTYGAKMTHTARFRRQFRKFLSTDEIYITALEFFVNRSLFAGDWEMAGNKISFTEKGGVRNFRSFKHYAVATIEQEPASRPDKISFYNDTSGVTYAFTIKNNKIQLYELEESENGMQISRGKMIGELKKE
jgi:hypothetical protein